MAAAPSLMIVGSYTMPSPTSELINQLRAQADLHPDTPALSGAREMTLAELLDLAERLAGSLSRSMAPAVAWTLDESWRWVVTDLACLIAGRVAVPVPAFFTAAQKAATLAQIGHYLWVGESVRELPQPASRMGSPLEMPIAGLRGFEVNDDQHAVGFPPGTSKVTFTSGSTGNPKGVCLSDHLLTQVATSVNARLGDAHAARAQLALTPLAVLLENVTGLYRALLAGGVYILSGPGQRPVTGSSQFCIQRLKAALQRHRPGLMIATPRMLSAMTAQAPHPAFECLSFVAVGGAPLPLSALLAARAAGIPAYQGYGLSECGSVVSLNTPDDDGPDTVGRPLPHVTTSISATGELIVSGAGRSGYLGDNARPNHGVHTGDQARVDREGRLHFGGRIGQRIITDMGRNVAPEWVEATLEQAAPGLTACAIEHDGGIAAVIDAGNLNEAPIARAVATANAALPDYAQIRHWVTATAGFSVANGCLTGTGRPRRAQIAARYAALLAKTALEEPCSPS